MDRSITIHQVDVFTRVPLSGNAAGVVLGADGLTGSAMQAIAREMNLSETAFVFAEQEAGFVPVRFFTPIREVPVCGHATLAAHFVRASAEGRREDGEVTQVSPGARWAVRWRREGDDMMVFMSQGPVEYGAVWDGEARRSLLVALETPDDALAADLPVQVVSTGHAKVVVPIRSAQALAAIQPDMRALADLSATTGVAGYFLFARSEAGHDPFTTCRTFAPAIGIPEDPVNGSGHGPLGAYLLEHDAAAARFARAGFWSSMGMHLGRPGQVWVRVLEGERYVEVGGYVTPVFSARLSLPDDRE